MTQDNSQAKTKAPAKSARRRARELALQGLYQWLLNRNDPGVVEAHLQDAQGFNKADRAHFDALLHGAIREETTLTRRSRRTWIVRLPSCRRSSVPPCWSARTSWCTAWTSRTRS